MKTYRQFLVSGAILLSLNNAVSSLASPFTTTPSGVVHAAVLGDNYPTMWKKGFGIDSWNMYLRQCTSFVAFRLSSANGFSLPRGYGNADSWGHTARNQGYQVNKNPKIGAVAWWDKGINQSHALYGHVAWVADIKGDYVTIEEYNYNAGQGPEKYHKRTIHKNHVSGYIHFKDLNTMVSHQVQPISQEKPETTTSLAQSGTYHFTSKSPIKGEPKLSSPDLTHYDAGQSVHYDQVVTAEGYEWISYLSFSGNRRYIPIRKIAEQPSPSKPSVSETVTVNITVGDTVSFPEAFQVTSVQGNLVTSASLAGGEPTHYNLIDPTPVNETDAAGNISGDQVLQPGEYFSIPGTYKVLKVDKPSNGIYVQIGSRGTWVSTDKAKKI